MELIMKDYKQRLLQYKMDYSVYLLRLEKKYLGRRLRHEVLSDEQVLVIRHQIDEITATLKLLKKKYGID